MSNRLRTHAGVHVLFFSLPVQSEPRVELQNKEKLNTVKNECDVTKPKPIDKIKTEQVSEKFVIVSHITNSKFFVEN